MTASREQGTDARPPLPPASRDERSPGHDCTRPCGQRSVACICPPCSCPECRARAERARGGPQHISGVLDRYLADLRERAT